jgi:hypothetical protein
MPAKRVIDEMAGIKPAPQTRERGDPHLLWLNLAPLSVYENSIVARIFRCGGIMVKIPPLDKS